MKKTNRLLSFILAIILVFTGVMPVYADGDGGGGKSVSVSGGGHGNWGRTYCGAGYLVSIVKYSQDPSKMNTVNAISESALNSAYKDAILVYNSRTSSDYVANHTVTVSLGIMNGTKSQGGGKLLNSNGDYIGESSSVNCFTAKAIKASTNNAKKLLGFESKFGKKINGKDYLKYETTDFHNKFGIGGTFNFADTAKRDEWFDIVDDIFGSHKSTLGGVNREKWVNISAGDDCIYCLLIIPVALFANSTSPSSTTVIACYPAQGFRDRSSVIKDCQVRWGSYDDVKNSLNDIKGKNLRETKYIFRGYVPYGGKDVQLGDSVAVNVISFIERENLTGSMDQVDDMVYSILGSNRNYVTEENPLDSTTTGSFKDVGFIYQDSYYDDGIKTGKLSKRKTYDTNKAVFANIAYPNESERLSFKAYESSISQISSSKPVLTDISGKKKYAVTSILHNCFDSFAFHSVVNDVEGNLVSGRVNTLQIAYGDDFIWDNTEDDNSTVDEVDESTDAEYIPSEDDDSVEGEDIGTGDDEGSSDISGLPDNEGVEPDDISSSDNGGVESDNTSTTIKIASLDVKSSGKDSGTKDTDVKELKTLDVKGNDTKDKDIKELKTLDVKAGNGSGSPANGTNMFTSLTGALLDQFDSFDRYNIENTGRLAAHTLFEYNNNKISECYMKGALNASSQYKKISKTADGKACFLKPSKEKGNIGLGVQLYTKSYPIKSYLKVYDVKVDKDGNYLDSNEVAKKSYTYNDMIEAEMKYDFLDTSNKQLKGVYYLFVPNDITYDTAYTYSMKNPNYRDPLNTIINNGGNPSDYYSWTNTVIPNADSSVVWGDNFVVDETSCEYYAVKQDSEDYPHVGYTVCNETRDGIEDSIGFSVYAVRVYEEVEVKDKIETESTLELKDYELSHVYNSIYSDSSKAIMTTSDCSQGYPYTVVHYVYTRFGPVPVYHTAYKDDYRRYIWLDTKKTEGVRSVSSKFNNVGAWKTYVRLPQYDKNIIPAGSTYPTSTLILANNQLVDERIMLTRDMGIGDSVLPSSISKQCNSTVNEFIRDVLKMTPANKPASLVKGSVVRDSNYLFTHATDIFKFRGGWYESPNPPERTMSYDPKIVYCHNSSYRSRKSSYRKTLYSNGIVSNVINVTLTENIYKYLTGDVNTGKNTEKVISSKLINAPDSANVGSSGSIKSLNKEYAFPMIKNNKSYNGNTETHSPLTTNYYSEVEMIAEIPSKGDLYSTLDKYKVWMMSEKLRKVENSSLYFVSAESHNDDAIDRANTKLYSDNSVSNRNGSNGTPILYSGADVDLAVKMNIDIDTFGYSLDLINQNEVPAGIANYKKIVYDESNLVNDWGNTSNKTNLLKSFKTFSKDIFESIDADIILEEKDNGKKYGNFSTSLGKYKEQSGGAKEDGVYQIVMKNGVLVESNPSYQLMLKQLAKDYYGDETKTAQAKSLFLASGIYQTIKDSVESSISSLNRSQVHPESSYNGRDIHLGNDNHWYDEQVKTFVIRRYRDSARFKDVTLSDKLDYNMGNTSNGRNDATQNSYNNSDCQWYLYLYYNKKHASDYMKNIITDWYDPSKDATRQTAINSSTILVNHLYIPSVDFRIASDTAAN